MLKARGSNESMETNGKLSNLWSLKQLSSLVKVRKIRIFSRASDSWDSQVESQVETLKFAQQKSFGP